MLFLVKVWDRLLSRIWNVWLKLNQAQCSNIVICHYPHLFLWYASLSTCGLRNVVRSKFYHALKMSLFHGIARFNNFSWHLGEKSKLEREEYWMISSFPRDIYCWLWTMFSYSDGFYFPFLMAVIGTCLVTAYCENLWISVETQRDLYNSLVFLLVTWTQN